MSTQPIVKRSYLHARPENVGIVGMEVYFPTTVVSQKELEIYDGVSTGKYTIGLGQQHMGFCADREDAISMALTTVSGLLKNYNIAPAQIGRLEVGTETILDKSKSIKSSLMQLFRDSGNHSIEGIDTYNACYGGTSALLNTVAWVESSAWDGRYGIVVCGDIAVYASGPARPTGGAGSVALLIGPNAPVVIEPGVRGSYFDHCYDFYKPHLSSEYPVVDGKLSLSCYITAVHRCYENYKRVFASSTTGCNLTVDASASTYTSPEKNVEVDYLCLHSPYTKLVRKSFARMLYHEHVLASSPLLGAFPDKNICANVENRDCESIFAAKSAALFDQKIKPSLTLAENVGNTYTASLYFGLASLIASLGGKALENKRALLFSYGSGLASTMFSVYFTTPDALVYANLASLHARLEARSWRSPAEYVAAMQLRESTHGLAPYAPVSTLDDIAPATYYLSQIDDKCRRQYQCKQTP